MNESSDGTKTEHTKQKRGSVNLVMDKKLMTKLMTVINPQIQEA